MKRILYVGGFELPDKSAAAIRVMNNALLFKDCNFETYMLGVHKEKQKDKKTGVYKGFFYETIRYPKTIAQWFHYLIVFSSFDVVDRIKPDIIILYDFPGLAILRWIKYCRKKRIKVIGDVTEWYMPTGNVIMKLLRGADTGIRMRYAYNKLDGMLTISRFLYNYYRKSRRMLLPPLMDKRANLPSNYIYQDKLTLVYAGSGGKNKDRLDYIVEAINLLDNPKLSFKIIGLDKEKYNQMYDKSFVDKWGCIVFLGKLDHENTVKEIINSHFQIFVRPINRVTTAGFPSKLVESFGLGVPVITNNTSNIAEYVINGVNGFLMNSINPEDIKSMLERLLQMSHKELMDIQKRCKNDTSFDFRSYVDEMKVFLNNIIDK